VVALLWVLGHNILYTYIALLLEPTPDEGTVVVAHSLGCLSVLRRLRSLTGPWRLGTLVLVAGFLEPLPALPRAGRLHR